PQAAAARQEPRATTAVHGETGSDRGDPARGESPRPDGRGPNDGGGQGGAAPDPMMVNETELRLRVGTFDGPFDLLLHLCRTNEIDLAALPVRTITDQYLAHLEAMEFRDLETAGAYLVMAATLIYLKSKLLVPPAESDEQLDDEGLALKQELEDRLRAYARAKTQGAWLASRDRGE